MGDRLGIHSVVGIRYFFSSSQFLLIKTVQGLGYVVTIVTYKNKQLYLLISLGVRDMKKLKKTCPSFHRIKEDFPMSGKGSDASCNVYGHTMLKTPVLV